MRTMRRPTPPAVLLAVALAACSDPSTAPPLTPDVQAIRGAAPNAVPTFITRQLGLPSGAFGGQAADINDRGMLIGEATTALGSQGFMWTSGKFTVVPGIAGYSEVALRGVNNVGTIVGQAYNRPTNTTVPVVWTGNGSVATPLSGFDPAGLNWAHDVNDAGTVVGEGRIQGKPDPTAFRWTAGGGVRLLSLDGGWSQAYRINRSGQVLGLAVDRGGMPQVVIWNPAGATTLLPVPIRFVGTLPTGINDAGAAVGWTLPLENPTAQRPVRWNQQKFELLPLPAGTVGGVAFDIDNAGRAYGYGYGPGFSPRIPVMWMPDGSVHPLPDPSGGSTNGPNRVNRCGQGAGAAPDRSTWTIWATEC